MSSDQPTHFVLVYLGADKTVKMRMLSQTSLSDESDRLATSDTKRDYLTYFGMEDPSESMFAIAIPLEGTEGKLDFKKLDVLANTGVHGNIPIYQRLSEEPGVGPEAIFQMVLHACHGAANILKQEIGTVKH